MSTPGIEAHEPRSLLESLLVLCLAALATMFACKFYLDNDENHRLRQASYQANGLFCHYLSLPDICPAPVQSQVTETAPAQPSPQPRLHSQAPTLTTDKPTLDNLTWRGGTELEATTFLVEMKTLELTGKTRYTNGTTAKIDALVTSVYRDYPELTAASSCTFCGTTADTVLRLVKAEEQLPEWFIRVGRHNDRFLPLMAERGVLSEEELGRRIKIQSTLGHGGDFPSRQLVRNWLMQNNEVELLKKWLVCSADITGDELARLPDEVIVSAWRSSVAGGCNSYPLTEYLLSRGYRPALRWLIWLRDDGAPYLVSRYSEYSHDRHRYDELFDRHTEFGQIPHHQIGLFYSQRWREIVWDPGLEKWLLLEHRQAQ